MAPMPAMDATGSTGVDHFPFLKLPLELRRMVYNEYAAEIPITYDLRSISRYNADLTSRAEQESNNPHTAYATRYIQPLSLVCKEINAEFNEELERLCETEYGCIVQMNLLTPEDIRLPTSMPVDQIQEVKITFFLDAMGTSQIISLVDMVALLESMPRICTVKFEFDGTQSFRNSQIFHRSLSIVKLVTTEICMARNTATANHSLLSDKLGDFETLGVCFESDEYRSTSTKNKTGFEKWTGLRRFTLVALVDRRRMLRRR